MRIIDAKDVKAQAMETEGAYRVTMRVLIGCEQNAPTFVMRLFEIGEGGHTPMHMHDWEHEVYVVSGEGEVATPDQRVQLVPDNAVYVAPGEMHQFVNLGDEPLRFLCIIPLHGQPC